MANRPYANEWDESIPESFNAFFQGDDRIREVKTQIREIFEEDHVMNENDGSGDNWGFHKQVTLMEQSGFPAEVTGAGIFFTKEKNSKAELYYMDNNNSSQQLTSGGFFIGGMFDEIRMWSGTLVSIGDGWVLCDSDSGVNLIGKFIRGISTTLTEPGSTGGSDSITLDATTMPAHTHSVTGGSHGHTALVNPGGVGSGHVLNRSGLAGNFWQYGDGAHTHTSQASGTGTPFNNRPAYYELAFIKRS